MSEMSMMTAFIHKKELLNTNYYIYAII